ncbi:hypothetical protein ACOBV9_18430 (plasmid) [Pseudoalteromonas espejiana]
MEPATARVIQQGRVSFVTGSEIEITFANDDFSGSGMFFCSCAESFCAICSYQ